MHHLNQTKTTGAPRRNRYRWGWITGAVAVVALVLACGTGGTDSGGGSAAADEDRPGKGDKKPAAARIGEPARDGNFEFTVSKVKCGVSSVGSTYLKHKAGEGNQFCLVTLTVENIGDEAQLFSDTDQYAYDADAKEYSADSEASIYANGDGSQVFFEEINPGSTLKGKIVFKISKKTKLVKLELHDSGFSDGVAINIKKS